MPNLVKKTGLLLGQTDNMDNASSQEHSKLGWSFPSTFWYANGAELCERAAYYGMFITLFRYLNIDIGFTDREASLVMGGFAGGIYFFPTFMGIMADKIGFKQALLIAFSLLTVGYALLGGMQSQPTALCSLALIMFGGAIIKPVISGTVAKCSDDTHRARAMSIFYMVVNIGSFSGKGLAGYLNEALGLQYINFYAAGMSLTALLLVGAFYKNVDTAGTGKTVKEALRGLWTVMQNFRFLALIFIIAGFWLIQGQLYGAMPTFIERVLGQGYKPEWLANINPLVVVLLVVPITHVVRHFRPVNAIGIGMFIIPFTALVIAMGPTLETAVGSRINLGFWAPHPLILLIIVGIALQGLAECFLSPKFLQFASDQAPKGEVGLYLGYQHLTTFIAWLAGFIVAGVLLNAYCPDPRTLEPEVRHEWRMATDPKYQFTLTEPMHAQLDEEGGVPASLRQTLAGEGFTISDTALLTERETKDAWRSDPERSWFVETPLYTVRLSQSKSEPAKLLAHSEQSATDGAVITLEAKLEGLFEDDAPMDAELREAFQENGVELPPEAMVKKDDSKGGSDEEKTWKVVLLHCVIKEAKLEATAEARANGREVARREVLVLGTVGRSPDEMPKLPDAYKDARYIWFVFAGIGIVAFFGLLLFKFITGRIDANREGEPETA